MSKIVSIHLAALALAGGLFACAAAAQDPPPASVKAMVEQGYSVVTTFAITGGYAVMLQKESDLQLCQININPAGDAFATTKCYPIN